MKNKKMCSLLLAAAMGMSALVGCGGQSAPEKGNSAPASDAGKEETTNIIWMIRSAEPKNYDSVMAAVNEKLKNDINMTLDLRFVDPGDYNTKMQMAMAGGDDWDLCFTASWANNYVNAAGKGALLQLSDEMLKENAPNMMKTIPEQLWDGIRVNGGIYALMNYQVMYDQAGFMMLKSAVDEQNIDVNAIKDWDSMSAAFEKLAAAYPDKYATRGGCFDFALMFRDEAVSTVMGLPFLAFDPETNKLSNTMLLEDSEAAMAAAKSWKDKGYIPADAATMQDEATMLTEGKILSRYQRMKPGLDAALKVIYKSDWVSFPCSTKIINTNAVQSTLTGVNVNSKHPEKAIQLFDYIFGNKEVSNMLFFGLEGQDYELVDGRVKKLENSWTAPAWMLGNQFNAYLGENDAEGIWEETMKGNEEADLDALFGFVPDRTPIETELATCEAIWGEYKDILYFGLQDYKTVVPEMMDKLQKAGLEKVTAELQSQIDAFLAAK